MPGTTTAPLPDEAEPPFLQEPTEAIVTDPVRQPLDQMVDFVYQWRLALGLGLLPVFLAVIALAYDPRTPDDPVLTAGDGETSSFEAIVQGVVPGDGDGDSPAAAALDRPDDESQTAGRQDEERQDDERPALPTRSDTAPATSSTTSPTTTDTAPPSTVETTAPPSSSTTSETTVPTTAPTTAPPITVVECLVTLDRRESPLYAGPSKDTDKIAKVERGTYAAFTEEDDFFLIDYRGTAGWIRAKHVEDVEGEC